MQNIQPPRDIASFFAEQWKVYRDFIEFDLMHHKDLFSLLKSRIQSDLPTNYHLLDLACGDSDPATKLLLQHPAGSYVGVDIAKPVLDLAESNLKTTSTPFQLIARDFVDHLQETDATFDLVLLSFSLHHLATSLKEDFFRLARKRIKPGGFLAVIDGMRLTGQSREQWLVHCYRYMEERSGGQCQSSCETARDHMIAADFPEEAIHYEQMARDAGFDLVELVCHDPDSSFGLLVAQVNGDPV